MLQNFDKFCTFKLSKLNPNSKNLGIIHVYVYTTSVPVPKISKEMERRGKTPEETSVLFHATLASTAAPWGWADDWEHQSNHVWDGCRGHPELLATKLVCLFKALISHSVMFFLEHGYFSGTVISAIPHQGPFWALSLSLSPDRLGSVNQMFYSWFELIHLL